MHKPPPDYTEFSSLTETNPTGYAKPIDEFDEVELSFDHSGNLTRLRDMLVQRRRHLAQDVVAYPMTFTGRAYDIAKLQPIIEAVERAIEHEASMGASIP
jgi:hypothetical protein